MNTKLIFIAGISLALMPLGAGAQNAEARTVQYHSQDIVPILGDLRQSPYSAQIEFEKVFTNPADQSVIKREQWTASVTYAFQEKVRNEELAVNPLGLTIVRFRADQAFE